MGRWPTGLASSQKKSSFVGNKSLAARV